MSSFIYQGKINIETNDTIYLQIEEKINTYFENEIEYCGFPIIRPYKNELQCIYFSIPFDNTCRLETFEKDIIKVMYLIEKFGNCKMKESYINVFEVFHVEDPVQYKYTIKRKEEKLVLMKQVYKRDLYIKMKNYLKKSTKENLQFYEILFQN